MNRDVHDGHAEVGSVREPDMTTATTCTIIARNYLAHARVLARSYSEHHPGQRLQVLVIDDRDGTLTQADELFDTISPFELPT